MYVIDKNNETDLEEKYDWQNDFNFNVQNMEKSSLGTIFPAEALILSISDSNIYVLIIDRDAGFMFMSMF